jgi:hypothetical protein
MLSDSYDLIFLVFLCLQTSAALPLKFLLHDSHSPLRTYVIITKRLQIRQFVVISIACAFMCSSHFRSPVSGLLRVTSSTLLG